MSIDVIHAAPGAAALQLARCVHIERMSIDVIHAASDVAALHIERWGLIG